MAFVLCVVIADEFMGNRLETHLNRMIRPWSPRMRLTASTHDLAALVASGSSRGRFT